MWKFPVAFASMAIANEWKSGVITKSAISSGATEANLSVSILSNREFALPTFGPVGSQQAQWRCSLCLSNFIQIYWGFNFYIYCNSVLLLTGAIPLCCTIWQSNLFKHYIYIYIYKHQYVFDMFWFYWTTFRTILNIQIWCIHWVRTSWDSKLFTDLLIC